MTINIKGRLLDFSTPKVMGIVNVTPDSFYAGSRTPDATALHKRIEQMAAQGVDIFDVGGYSTRPGADEVTAQQEMQRLSSGISAIRSFVPDAIVSVDTFRADVAARCVEHYGADIINDVSGGTLDAEMFATVARLQVPYVLMHMRGTPATMARMCDYADVAAEVLSELSFKLAHLRSLGVNDVIIDPGFGFAKDVKQNYQLLRNLEVFKSLECPLLVGVSRKSMLFKPLGITPADAANATTVVNTIALMKGADILRVHDVEEARQCVQLCEMTKI